MRTACLSLLALSLLTPLAAAEGETARIEDARLDAILAPMNAYADIAAVSLDAGADAIHATLHLTALPELPPGVAYVVVFEVDGVEWYAAAMGAPTARFEYGRWSAMSPDTRSPATGGFTRGTEAHVTIEVPLAALAPRDDALTLRGALVVNFEPSPVPILGNVVVDEAWGEATLWLPATGHPGALQIELEDGTRLDVPGAGALVGGVAIAALALATRRWRA